MEETFDFKPRVCFEVEKVIGVSSDGSYQVQWAPAWVSRFHLVGCEHLIQEFLQQQQSEIGKGENPLPNTENDVPSLQSQLNSLQSDVEVNTPRVRFKTTPETNYAVNYLNEPAALKNAGCTTVNGGEVESVRDIKFEKHGERSDVVDITSPSTNIHSKRQSSECQDLDLDTGASEFSRADKENVVCIRSSESISNSSSGTSHPLNPVVFTNQLQADLFVTRNSIDNHKINGIQAEQNRSENVTKGKLFPILSDNNKSSSVVVDGVSDGDVEAKHNRDDLTSSKLTIEIDDDGDDDEDDEDEATEIHSTSPLPSMVACESSIPWNTHGSFDKISNSHHGSFDKISNSHHGSFDKISNSHHGSFDKISNSHHGSVERISNNAPQAETGEEGTASYSGFSEPSNTTDQTNLNPTRKHACTVCGKSFQWRSLLEIHYRTHTGYKPYACAFCNKTFTQSGNLLAHVRTHTGEKPHPCPLCDKAFAERSTLNKHISTHNVSKPFSCTHCEKTFQQSNQLKKHLREHKSRKFSCYYCGLEFATRVDLDRHAMEHSHGGAAMYTCYICYQSFSDMNTLNIHIQGHNRPDMSI